MPIQVYSINIRWRFLKSASFSSQSHSNSLELAAPPVGESAGVVGVADAAGLGAAATGTRGPGPALPRPSPSLGAPAFCLNLAKPLWSEAAAAGAAATSTRIHAGNSHGRHRVRQGSSRVAVLFVLPVASLRPLGAAAAVHASLAAAAIHA
jgi:hypothetical protein